MVEATRRPPAAKERAVARWSRRALMDMCASHLQGENHPQALPGGAAPVKRSDQPALDLLRLARFGEQPPLRRVAADLAEQLDLCLGLHALGDQDRKSVV